MEEPAPGFNIYRVRYDGEQMELIENVSETTGLGGVDTYRMHKMMAARVTTAR
jgi:hypothetical protein